MEQEFENSIFTYYFNLMIYLGFWVLETCDPLKKSLYFIYSIMTSSWILFIIYMGVLDLISSIPDVNKIFYNISVNLFIAGTWLKTLQNLRKSEGTNVLRRKLHRRFQTCKDREEVDLFKAAEGDLRIITRIFYFSLASLYPTWIFLSFFSDFWGERHLPLPAKWPVEVDIKNLKVFLGILVFQAIFSLFFLFLALAMDASMFGLLVQIHREYQFLIKRIHEFGAFCDDFYVDDLKFWQKKRIGEMNIYLKRAKARQMLGEIISRQKDLLGFTQDFESSYNVTMFIHIFAGGTLLCVNGVQSMIVAFDFSSKMSYQYGYVFTLLFDVLYLCWLTNRISTKVFLISRRQNFALQLCFEVGTALYTTPWYKMEVDVQKDISLVILRAQKPPRITSGNFIELSLRTFMGLMKNIYSWLALFRQVALK